MEPHNSLLGPAEEQEVIILNSIKNPNEEVRLLFNDIKVQGHFGDYELSLSFHTLDNLQQFLDVLKGEKQTIQNDLLTYLKKDQQFYYYLTESTDYYGATIANGECLVDTMKLLSIREEMKGKYPNLIPSLPKKTDLTKSEDMQSFKSFVELLKTRNDAIENKTEDDAGGTTYLNLLSNYLEKYKKGDSIQQKDYPVHEYLRSLLPEVNRSFFKKVDSNKYTLQWSSLHPQAEHFFDYSQLKNVSKNGQNRFTHGSLHYFPLPYGDSTHALNGLDEMLLSMRDKIIIV